MIQYILSLLKHPLKFDYSTSCKIESPLLKYEIFWFWRKSRVGYIEWSLDDLPNVERPVTMVTDFFLLRLSFDIVTFWTAVFKERNCLSQRKYYVTRLTFYKLSLNPGCRFYRRTHPTSKKCPFPVFYEDLYRHTTGYLEHGYLKQNFIFYRRTPCYFELKMQLKNCIRQTFHAVLSLELFILGITIEVQVRVR